MAKAKYAFLFFLFGFSTAKVTPSYHEKLDWMHMQDLSAKMKENPRPVLIDLYTNWCSWCKVMDDKTYGNQQVVDYIRTHFYAVKLDAQSKEVVDWKNRSYEYNEGYQVNDFALSVTSGNPGFPTTVIVPDEKSSPLAVPGYLDAEEMEPVLKYFGEGAYKTESYSEFKAKFTPSW